MKIIIKIIIQIMDKCMEKIISLDIVKLQSSINNLFNGRGLLKKLKVVM